MDDQQRPETGPVAFGDDWPGVFVRGDDAIGLTVWLREALAVLPADALAGRMALERAIALLSSCLCRGGLPEGVQHLRAWGECQPEAAASKEGE